MSIPRSLLLALALAACARDVPPPPARPNAALALALPTGSDPADRRIAAAQASARANPGSAAAHVALARLLVRRQRETSRAVLVDAADDAVRVALALDPTDLDALELQALLRHARHEFAAARTIARRIIARAPERPTGYLLAGDAALELGDYEDALAAYQRAIDLRPDLRSYNRGAHLRFLHGDFAGAEELLTLALDAGSARDPESTAWCWVDLGTLHLLRGRAPEASAAAHRALALVPEYLPALALDARARALAGDRTGAIGLLERVTARAATTADLVELAELHAAQGNAGASAAALAQARAHATQDPRPLAAYLARRGEDHEGALSLARVELDRRANLETEDTMALALARAGRIAEAVGYSGRALRLGTPDARMWLHRALILSAAADAEGARKALRRAVDLNPTVDPPLRAEVERALGAG